MLSLLFSIRIAVGQAAIAWAVPLFYRLQCVQVPCTLFFHCIDQRKMTFLIFTCVSFCRLCSSLSSWMLILQMCYKEDRGFTVVSGAHVFFLSCKIPFCCCMSASQLFFQKCFFFRKRNNRNTVLMGCSWNWLLPCLKHIARCKQHKFSLIVVDMPAGVRNTAVAGSIKLAHKSLACLYLECCLHSRRECWRRFKKVQ